MHALFNAIVLLHHEPCGYIAIYICQNNRNTWSDLNNDEMYDNMHLHFH